MKAAILLSPVNKDGVNIGFFNKVMRNFIKNPVPLGEVMNGNAGVSEILLLPVYVDTVEYLKYDSQNGTNGPTQLMMVKKAGSIFEGQYDYLKIPENSVVKIGGRIVFLSLDKKAKAAEGATGNTVEEKDLTNGIKEYSKMGKEEQKRFRQKTGKKLIEYVSNLTAINQLSEWAISNDTPPTEAEQKKGQNPEKRDPSQPADAYRGITKSLTIVYFKDDKPMEKKDSASKWDSEKDAEKEYEYAEIQKRLDAIEKEISSLDAKIKNELYAKEDRDLKKRALISKYGNENDMKSRLNTLKTEMDAASKNKDSLNNEKTRLTAANAKESDLENVELKIKEAEEQEELLKTEKQDIEGVLKNDMEDEKTLAELKKYRAQQNKLIEEKEGIKKDKLKGQANYEAYKEQEDLKNWTESLLGVELEVPLRYMYIPEVELVSYSEEMNLAESEGRFEVLLKQSFKREQYVEVGDPLSLGKKGLGKLIGGISKIFGSKDSISGGKDGNDN